MKTCKSCGRECRDTDSFCSNCGSSEFLTQSEPVNTNGNVNGDASVNANNNEQQNDNACQNQNSAQNGYFDPSNNWQKGAYYNPNDCQQQNAYNVHRDYNTPQEAERGLIDDAKVCGIVSLVIMIFGLSGLSWIPALIGKTRLKRVVNMRDSSEFSTAKILNNIGMILSIISIVFSFIVVIGMIVLFVSGVGMGVDLISDFASQMPSELPDELINEFENGFSQIASIRMLF